MISAVSNNNNVFTIDMLNEYLVNVTGNPKYTSTNPLKLVLSSDGKIYDGDYISPDDLYDQDVYNTFNQLVIYANPSSDGLVSVFFIKAAR